MPRPTSGAVRPPRPPRRRDADAADATGDTAAERGAATAEPVAVGHSRRRAVRRARCDRRGGHRPADVRVGPEPAAVDPADEQRRDRLHPERRDEHAGLHDHERQRHVVALDGLPERAQRHGRAARRRPDRRERRAADVGSHALVGRARARTPTGRALRAAARRITSPSRSAGSRRRKTAQLLLY